MKTKEILISKKQEKDIELDIDLGSKDIKESADHIMYLVVNYQLNKSKDKCGYTKGRSEVRGGGAKPYKQKGTGRARCGTSRSPLKVGGGVIFGPNGIKRGYKLNKNTVTNAYKSIYNQKRKSIVIINTEDRDKWTLRNVKEYKRNDQRQIVVSTVIDEKECKLLSYIGDVYSVNSIPIIELASADCIYITDSAFSKLKEKYSK